MNHLTPTAQTASSIHVSVDHRVELISVLQFVGDYGNALPFLLNTNTFSYATEVINHFSAFRHHPAVEMVNELCSRPGGFNFMAPPTTMLYLRDDFSLRDDVLWPEDVLARVGGRETLELLVGHLQSLGGISGFAEFYEAHALYYERLVATVVTKLGEKDYVEGLEAFYGAHQDSYNLILVPLYGYVGFGPHVDTLAGERHIYNIMGPQEIREGVPFFGDTTYFRTLQRHEFSHSFVNPLTDKYWEHVQAYAQVYERLPEQSVCGDWAECVNEYIIRAITTHLAFCDGQAAGQAALDLEKRRNVVLIDDLLSSVRDYAAHRDLYPTLDDYYLRLLEAFVRGAQRLS